MTSVNVLCVQDTVYSADSIEWCPIQSLEHIFVCANYQLASDTSEIKTKRFGKIRLYSYSIQRNELKLHQIVDNEAVLDQKWCHHRIENVAYLGVVSAKNTLELYRLDPQEIKLIFVTSINNKNDDILMLSLDWNCDKYASENPMIVTSDSQGNVSQFNLKNNELKLSCSWKAHDYEAWICAFYYWNTSIVFSGGDDSRLLTFDLRQGTNPINICRQYTAGVTSIHSNQNKEHLIAVGSYDSNLNLWDIRNMKQSVSHLKMPDSVWRLKWNPNNYDYLLAACMREGFHVIDSIRMEIVASYYEHKDIAYGCDWKYFQNDPGEFIIGACSFYDHKMSVAKVHLTK